MPALPVESCVDVDINHGHRIQYHTRDDIETCQRSGQHPLLSTKAVKAWIRFQSIKFQTLWQLVNMNERMRRVNMNQLNYIAAEGSGVYLLFYACSRFVLLEIINSAGDTNNNFCNNIKHY